MMDDGIWGRAEVSLCIYLEVCMVFCSISGGVSVSLPHFAEVSQLPNFLKVFARFSLNLIRQNCQIECG